MEEIEKKKVTFAGQIRIRQGIFGMKKRKLKRHPAAIVLEKWYESEEGVKCLEGSTSGRFLKNRLYRAFMAGWNEKEKSVKNDSCRGD